MWGGHPDARGVGYRALMVSRRSLDEPEIVSELLKRFPGHGYVTERLPRSIGVEQAEHRSHRLECGQRPWPEQDLDLREAPGAERPESVGNLLG